METGLRGSRALITGGGSGIGRAIALSLADEGADVVICGRRDRSDVASEISGRGVRSRWLEADVSKESDVISVVREASDQLGGLDLYINVAAGTWHQPLTRMTKTAWEQTLGTNVAACVWGCREVARQFITQGHGAIVVIGSTATVSAQPQETAYRASKAALKAHVEVAAVELAPFGIRVNMVTPGGVDTAFVADADPDQRASAIGQIPLGREAIPEEIAPAATFLLSDRLARYVTGSDLLVDGGLHLRPIRAGSDEDLRRLNEGSGEEPS
jgi:NAD(P)-dependent dehydrogenase (short-subunit alcohol dehydrogenase family)